MALEYNESFNAPAECSQNMCSLGDFALVRPEAQLAEYGRQLNKNLEDAGVLPKIDLKMWNGDDDEPELKNPFKNDNPDPVLKNPFKKDITTKDMKDVGAKATESLDKDGKKVTTVETKSGVKVTVTEGKETTKPDGTKVKGPDTVKVDGPAKASKDGKVWTDNKGREIVKRNKDGSVTVDAGEGTFVRQDSQGVKKASVVRPPDGKIQDNPTDTPLGNERPGDQVKPSKK